MFVPVVDQNQNPLMPTTPSRARRWIKSGKATPFWKRGVFCVRLNIEPSSRNLQPIAIGVDPASNRETFTIKSKVHTYINPQTHAVDWVKDALEIRGKRRRTRRFRNAPCRQPRAKELLNSNRLALSTKARWQLKLRICWWLVKLFPVTHCAVEDIQAVIWKNGRNGNISFSPWQVGKQWFYLELEKLGIVETQLRSESKKLHNSLKLKKSKNKLAKTYSAHFVNSWVLANFSTGRHLQPDKTEMLIVIPLRFHRSQLHRLEEAPSHVKLRDGGTLSDGLKRGCLVKNPKYGLAYMGGFMDKPTQKNPDCKLISLRCPPLTGKRVYQNAVKEDLRFLTFNSWRTANIFASSVQGANSSCAVSTFEAFL